MPETHLEFEKPIVELRKKLQELQELSENNQLDLSNEINSLTERMNQTMKEIYSKLTPWQRVQLARHPERPYTLDYIDHLFTNFIELSGDRRFRDDKAIVGGFAKFQGKPVMVIGTQKGRDMKSNVYRNFGWPSPEGYRKALRLMKQAEKFHRPVICIVDTAGAYCGIDAEERGQGQAIAENLYEMITLKTPIVSLLIGEGGSGGALALAVADEVWMMENSVYSVISPEGCASILWKDAKKAPEAAKALKLTASDLLSLGVIDRVIRENGKDFTGIYHTLKKRFRVSTERKLQMPVEDLIEQRYKRFRKM